MINCFKNGFYIFLENEGNSILFVNAELTIN